LLVQEAQSKGLDQTPETIERLAMMRASVLSQLAVEDYIKANPVTDADLKADIFFLDAWRCSIISVLLTACYKYCTGK
jgi:hypothetical protein